MPLERMEHYLVLTDDVEKTQSFYCDVLGLSAGYRPALAFAGCWLYLGDVPVIHVAEKASYAAHREDPSIAAATPESGTGLLDHIAFNATGFDETVARLETAGLPFRRGRVNDISLRQLFVEDPSGVCIELNFRDATG